MDKKHLGLVVWATCILWFAGIFGGLVGCSTSPLFRGTEVTLNIHGEYFNPCVIYWREEAQRYFHEDVLLVVGHGNGEDGVWMIHDDIAREGTSGKEPVVMLIARLREKYPHHRIVLICCNPDGIAVDAPGVSYALKNVWMFPDSVLEPGKGFDELTGEDEAGSFDEFVHNKW